MSVPGSDGVRGDRRSGVDIFLSWHFPHFPESPRGGLGAFTPPLPLMYVTTKKTVPGVVQVFRRVVDVVDVKYVFGVPGSGAGLFVLI